MKLPKLQKRLKDERGQAALELLLIFPTFLFIVLLAVDFGVLMYEYVSVANAAREGARFAAVNCDTGTCSTTLVCNQTIDHSSGVLGSDHGAVTVKWLDRSSPANTNRGKGDSAVVTINHQYDFLFVPMAHINVTSNADMRVEKDDGAGSLPSTDQTCS